MSDFKGMLSQPEQVSEYHDILLEHPNGTKCFIDFSRDGRVTFGGDMPIDDAAKMFFEMVADNFRQKP